ncbi:MAG: hypothetical protein OQJ96_09695 [Flavobacteriales bacterium]|nr:hypothetical protein [Flavobacteriales bacterium]MCW8913788.1 hypothetical protein [Flavobacteriales bacterium]MCW8938424.1 hypothetical protein [Flavobacteriales bacterium]MCW8940113.1 hypothetical protein [Flavobacteriales bacterium]MCW8969125.1 hypothetical protein [Flavobacteriales bacterium]
MKTTKIFGTLFFSFLLLGATSSFAQQRIKPTVKKEVVKEKMVEKQNVNVSNVDASKVLSKTNQAITAAFSTVNEKKVYSGDLSKAVHHQKIAKKLMSENKNFRAIHHSRMARTLAFRSLRLNKNYDHEKWDYTMEEQALFGNGIPDGELIDELNNTYPNNQFLDEKITEKDLKDIEVKELDPADSNNN